MKKLHKKKRKRSRVVTRKAASNRFFHANPRFGARSHFYFSGNPSAAAKGSQIAQPAVNAIQYLADYDVYSAYGNMSLLLQTFIRR